MPLHLIVLKNQNHIGDLKRCGLLLMDQQKRGKEMCKDLAYHGYKADWFLDVFGELFFIINNVWLMRRIGTNEDGNLLWVAVQPSFKSITAQQYNSQRKLDYTPIFAHNLIHN